MGTPILSDQGLEKEGVKGQGRMIPGSTALARCIADHPGFSHRSPSAWNASLLWSSWRGRLWCGFSLIPVGLDPYSNKDVEALS